MMPFQPLLRQGHCADGALQCGAVAAPGLDQEALDVLNESIEIDLLTPRRDGSISRRPIWVVVVDGDAYVRSYLAARGAWYQRVLVDGQATIAFDSRSIDVGLEPNKDPDLNRRVSDAFRAKYGERSPGSTEAMLSPEVSETTLRLTSR
jgi:hypothetical protein